jgi:hypothetical protein
MSWPRLPLTVREQLRIEHVRAANKRRKGEKRSPEAKSKMRLAKRRRPLEFTPAYRAKLSAAQKLAWKDPTKKKHRVEGITEGLNTDKYRALKAAETLNDWESLSAQERQARIDKLVFAGRGTRFKKAS